MKRLSLRTLVLLHFILVIILMFLLQFGIVNLILYPKQAERESNLIQTQVESEASKAGAVFYQELGVLDVLARTYEMEAGELYDYFIYVEEFNREFYVHVNEASRRLMLCDTQGKGYLPDGEKSDLSQLNLFKTISTPSADGRFHYVNEDMWLGSTWLFSSCRLMDIDENHEGYLLSFFNISRIFSPSTKELFPEDAVLWLMDENGTLLWESSIKEGQLARSSDALEMITQLAADTAEEESGMQRVSLGGSKNVAFSRIPYTSGWKLCVLWDNSGMGVQSRQYNVASWVIWGTMVALFSIMTLCLSYKVIRPIEQITRAIQKAGNDTKESIKQEFGVEEIDHLARSINAMRHRINQLFENVRREQEAKRGAEQRVLQAQITPHFLYNTLDNISWRAVSCGNCQISDIISALSTFFRISLSDGREFITWNDEAEHIYSYLFIQQMRYEDKLDFDIDMDQSIRDYYVIKLVLQPLVENALYHGIKPKEGRGRIKVSIAPMGDKQIHVIIEDDGVGMSPERLDSVRKTLERGSVDAGFGLCTTLQRLRLTYGEECVFSIDSTQGQGTIIDIILPMEEERRPNG